MENGGDAISLVSELLNINALEATKSINYNLGLGLDINTPISHFETNTYKQKRETEEKFKEWENNTLKLLCDYLHLLYYWEKTENWTSKLYIEAVNNKDYVDCLIDEIFLNGTNEDKIWFWKTQRKWVKGIESRYRSFRAIA